MFAMQLVVHLEESYDIAIIGPELKLDNFRTVQAMTAWCCGSARPRKQPAMAEPLADERAFIAELIGDQPGRVGPGRGDSRRAAAQARRRRESCARRFRSAYGGLGASSRDNGELTAYMGSLCSSVRSDHDLAGHGRVDDPAVR